MLVAKNGVRHLRPKGEMNGPLDGRPRIRLLLIDDQKITLEALKLYLSSRSDFQVLAVIMESVEDLEKLRRPTPDVIVLSLRMLHLDGATATKLLLKIFPGAKIIGFSGVETRNAVLAMLRAGACGYVAQACSATELFRAVETVTRGDVFFSSSIHRIIVNDYKKAITASVDFEPPALTSSERRILGLIADGQSNKEIAGAMSMSVRTIEKYRESLMGKLGIKSIAGLTKFAIRSGISSLDC